MGSPKHAPIFTSDTIKDLLRNPRFAGRVPLRDGRVVAGTFAALIDPATWEACQRIRSSQRRTVRNTAGAVTCGSPYLLSGLLRCSECGSTMSGQTWRPDRSHPEVRRSYNCYKRRVGGDCGAAAVPQAIARRTCSRSFAS